eukprot:CAMPEP_0206139664 /NCGR_PEP_ID=MMETSP1473-20131121/6984_1 /ASSEMBLY_ACC=CAM_ASM_001109 /TAXON_ID=1461547 /ORGANISM="Stichococcus sp, Strain RCC1054" /LENGTH=253 /DNA_ID=CAMNT_0053533543 /DNA_START=117 /DNA_END=878 /DNA_ORIENTATION=+
MVQCCAVHATPTAAVMAHQSFRQVRPAFSLQTAAQGTLWAPPLGGKGHGTQRITQPAFSAVAASSSASGAAQQSLSALKTTDDERAAQLKQTIIALAGNSNGTDRDEGQRKEIDGTIQQLEALNPAQSLAAVDLTGTEWRLVYSSSLAPSSGKIGPFVGRVWQEFPADQEGQYINWVSFLGGLFKAKLLADYKPTPGREDRLDVTFVNTIFMLGPFAKQQDMSNGGWWRLTYIDSNWRILYANTGNVFVLTSR